MARWNASVRLPIAMIKLFSLALTVEALQGKTCQDSLLSEEGRSLRAKISGGSGRPWGIFLVCTKLDTFCSDKQTWVHLLHTIQCRPCPTMRSINIRLTYLFTYCWLGNRQNPTCESCSKGSQRQKLQSLLLISPKIQSCRSTSLPKPRFFKVRGVSVKYSALSRATHN